MPKYLLLIAAVAVMTVGAIVRQNNHLRAESERLKEQQTWLIDELNQARGIASARSDSNRILRMRCAEFERLRSEDARQIRALGIRLRRLEATGRSVAVQQVEATTTLQDSLIVPATASEQSVQSAEYQPIADTERVFRWHDAWCSIKGRIRGERVVCRVESVDTLRQVIHRVPRRFLFIRWGTKCLRQEIVSSNPHTRIVYSEWIRIEK